MPTKTSAPAPATTVVGIRLTPPQRARLKKLAGELSESEMAKQLVLAAVEARPKTPEKVLDQSSPIDPVAPSQVDAVQLLSQLTRVLTDTLAAHRERLDKHYMSIERHLGALRDDVDRLDKSQQNLVRYQTQIAKSVEIAGGKPVRPYKDMDTRLFEWGQRQALEELEAEKKNGG